MTPYISLLLSAVSFLFCLFFGLFFLSVVVLYVCGFSLFANFGLFPSERLLHEKICNKTDSQLSKPDQNTRELKKKKKKNSDNRKYAHTFSANIFFKQQTDI